LRCWSGLRPPPAALACARDGGGGSRKRRTKKGGGLEVGTQLQEAAAPPNHRATSLQHGPARLPPAHPARPHTHTHHQVLRLAQLLARVAQGLLRLCELRRRGRGRRLGGGRRRRRCLRGSGSRCRRRRRCGRRLGCGRCCRGRRRGRHHGCGRARLLPRVHRWRCRRGCYCRCERGRGRRSGGLTSRRRARSRVVAPCTGAHAETGAAATGAGAAGCHRGGRSCRRGCCRCGRRRRRLHGEVRRRGVEAEGGAAAGGGGSRGNRRGGRDAGAGSAAATGGRRSRCCGRSGRRLRRRGLTGAATAGCRLAAATAGLANGPRQVRRRGGVCERLGSRVSGEENDRVRERQGLWLRRPSQVCLVCARAPPTPAPIAAPVA
jgi:hypothetical protein